MADIPEGDLEETRAALAPTLAATAAILPWLAKPRALRFAVKLNERWVAACRQLAEAWSTNPCRDGQPIRAAVFALYGVGLDTADADCLRLGEAFASAADALEEGNPPARLLAALTAAIECFDEPNGLEHVLFSERARHFSGRLENCLSPESRVSERSPVLDQLFASEALERLEQMREALAALPPDAYAIKLETAELAQQAAHLELYGIVHLCQQLAGLIPEEGRIDDLDSAPVRSAMLDVLQQLAMAIATVDA